MPQAKTVILAGAALATVVGLSGCGERGLDLGAERAPDEFTVVTRAPLALPPNFTLRPPQPGADRPQEQRPTERARSVLVGQTSAAASASQGETSILAAAGATTADPEIRQVVNKETSALEDKSDTFIDNLIFWQEQPGPEKVVDAASESDRLRSNVSDGRSVTEGETAVIENREKGWLEGLF